LRLYRRRVAILRGTEGAVPGGVAHIRSGADDVDVVSAPDHPVRQAWRAPVIFSSAVTAVALPVLAFHGVDLGAKPSSPLAVLPQPGTG
jgi:hypothetical protein